MAISSDIIHISRGANAPVGTDGTVSIQLEWLQSPGDLDISCFMVGSGGKVPSDDYMIFYNQAADPHKSVLFHGTEERRARFDIRLAAIPDAIDKCVFTATLDDGHLFRDVQNLSFMADGGSAKVVYPVEALAEEKALVLAELYRHSSGWKIRAVGRGFNGGLAPLARAHGVEVAEDEAAASAELQEPVKQAAPSQTDRPEHAKGSMPLQNDRPEPVKESAAARAEPAEAPSQPSSQPIRLSKIDLLKKKVAISLEKKNIASVKARVAVVLDASGSMYPYYKNGTVQRSFERALAVAAHMDDDGSMDVWFFGSKAKRMPSVSERDFEDYIKRTYPAPKAFGGVGAGNNEPIVMKDIMKKYIKQEPRKDIPTYILFFSDGGIYMDSEIEALLKEASRHNIFWQFIGIGSSSYGVLERLDNLQGRFIDNADFFAFDDMDRITDEQLYERLFNEFPGWLKEARRQGLLE